MGIFDRMGKVISSNFNSLLDKAEDDKKLLELNVEEMGEQLKAARQEVISAVAAEKQLRKKLDDGNADVERWDKRAELALKGGDEALAREALKQKRRAMKEVELTEKARSEARNQALEMKAELERMEQKLGELESKKGTIISKAKQAKAGGGTESLGASGSGPSAFSEFRRMEDQIEGVETAVQAQRELDEALGGRGPGGMTRDEVEAKFRALEYGGKADGPKGGSEVDDELAQLKKKIRIGS